MLKTQLLHPEILQALGMAGHGAKVLIADGNFPFTSGSNPSAKHVYLNLTHGLVTVTDVLKVLIKSIPIEAAEVMIPDSGLEPIIFSEFNALLPNICLKKFGRMDFYDIARERDVVLIIATGEQRVFSNLMLTIGVI
jgi:L-fucose mutarotase